MDIETPLSHLAYEPKSFEFVNEETPFVFKKLCPYCKGNLTYTTNGWEQDDNEQWMADSFDMECSSEPSMEDEEAWEEWMSAHSDMPYVNQLPVDTEVKKWINDRYRFILNS